MKYFLKREVPGFDHLRAAETRCMGNMNFANYCPIVLCQSN